jgi:hypothetical protein
MAWFLLLVGKILSQNFGVTAREKGTGFLDLSPVQSSPTTILTDACFW